jgi:DNA repair protein RadC
MGTDILYVRDRDGQFIRANPESVVAGARAHLRHRIRRGASLTSPELVRSFVAVNLGDRDCEYFCLLLLDGHHRFLRFVELFRGTIDRASVHPREIIKVIVDSQAAAVLLVHNHPSQNGEPSAADQQITRRVKDLLALMDVRVLDHLIVAGGDVTSLSERGLL